MPMGAACLLLACRMGAIAGMSEQRDTTKKRGINRGEVQLVLLSLDRARAKANGERTVGRHDVGGFLLDMTNEATECSIRELAERERATDKDQTYLHFLSVCTYLLRASGVSSARPSSPGHPFRGS